MGDFGKHLYENDFALDIKGDYEDGLAKGIDNKQLTQSLIEYYSEEEDIYYQMMFWVILADIQWQYGKVSEKVRKMALHYLEDENLLDSCLMEAESLKDIRKKELLDVRERLVSGTVGKKKVKVRRLYKCEWNIGDVFEYQLHTDDSGEYNGYYIYFVKCGEETWYPGHICPDVYVYAGVYKEQQQLCDLDGVEFLPAPLMRACDNVNEKFMYRVLLLSTSKRVVPQKYIRFLGNIKIVRNGKEIGSDKPPGNSIKWKGLDEYFIKSWESWKDCFDPGKMIKSETLKFKGRISRDEDYVRFFYSNSDYKTDDDVRRWIYSDGVEKVRLKLFPFLWSFAVIAERTESHDSPKWNGARYHLLYCEAKDLFYGCEERNLSIPTSIKDDIFMDVYDSHHDHIYYCDYSADFGCHSYYDKQNGIYSTGNPDGDGQCIEFAKGQYAVIKDTKLVIVYYLVLLWIHDMRNYSSYAVITQVDL